MSASEFEKARMIEIEKNAGGSSAKRPYYESLEEPEGIVDVSRVRACHRVTDTQTNVHAHTLCIPVKLEAAVNCGNGSRGVPSEDPTLNLTATPTHSAATPLLWRPCYSCNTNKHVMLGMMCAFVVVN